MMLFLCRLLLLRGRAGRGSGRLLGRLGIGLLRGLGVSRLLGEVRGRSRSILGGLRLRGALRLGGGGRLVWIFEGLLLAWGGYLVFG